MYSKTILSSFLIFVFCASPAGAFFGFSFGKTRPSPSEASSYRQSFQDRSSNSGSGIDSDKDRAVSTAVETIASKTKKEDKDQKLPSDDMQPPTVAIVDPTGTVESTGGLAAGTFASDFSSVPQRTSSNSESVNLLRKELQDVGKPIGPQQLAATGIARPHKTENYIEFQHASLRSRVRNAMSSLSILYDALHQAIALSTKLETSEDKNSSLEGPANISATKGEFTAKNEDGDFHEIASVESTIASQPERTAAESPPVLLAASEAHSNDTAARENLLVPDSNQIRTQSKMATWSGRSRGSSVVSSSLSALVGVMFVVVAVSLMVASFAQSHRMPASATPLFPPGGPAYV